MAENTKTLKIPKDLFRSGTAIVDPENKTVRMSISSDEPYLRYDWYDDEDYYEVLDHGPGGMDMSRLDAGTSLLFNHNRDILLGRNMGYENDGHKCYVDSKISMAPDVESYRIKIEEGILKATSVGYSILDGGECIGAKDGIPIYKFKWCPNEASLVTIEADTTVGIGRQRQKEQAEGKDFIELQIKSIDKSGKTSEKKSTMATEAPAPEAPKINVVEERQSAVEAHIKGCDQIDAYIDGLKNPQWKQAAQEIGRKHKRGAANFETFRAEAVEHFDGIVRVDTPATIGLNAKEKKEFSLVRAIRSLAMGNKLEGLEKEVSEAAAKNSRAAMRPDAIYLPEDITGYDLREAGLNSDQFRQYATRTNQNVTTATAGGFTVPTTLGSMIEFLRNSTVLGQAGITTIGGLQGDLAFPVQTGGAAAYWVSESGSGSDSAATFAIKAMTPHRLSGTIPFTTQFLAQTSLSAEQFCRNELMIVSALAIDLAGLEGTGANGQPLGVKNTTGVGADVTYGGAATWAKVVSSETFINTANANIGSMGWILSSATVGKWKTILKVTAGAAGQFLIENNEANGYPVHRTNQLSTNQSYFGVWSQLLHAMWATQEVIVDPYALKKTGGIEVTMNTFHDFLVRQPAAFEVSTDTAAT